MYNPSITSMYRAGAVRRKQQQLGAARRAARELIAQSDYREAERPTVGPRYYLSSGSWQRHPARFKLCLYTRAADVFTFEKFSREVLFLAYIQRAGLPTLRAAVPTVYQSGLTPRPWYVREDIGGQFQSTGGGIVRVRPSFYTASNLRWLSNVLSSLHRIKQSSLPQQFRRLLFQPDRAMHLWHHLQTLVPEIERVLHQPGVGLQLRSAIRQCATVYDRAPRVLAHQELYGCHFIRTERGFRLIDWENIGWSNPCHDAVVVWLRGHQHPAWQKKLFKTLRRRYRSYPRFTELWNAEVLIQCAFNVGSWRFFPDQRDFHALGQYCSRTLSNMLRQTPHDQLSNQPR
ncbi:MAG: phosphotransferase [Patescibacteria group bacterium]